MQGFLGEHSSNARTRCRMFNRALFRRFIPPHGYVRASVVMPQAYSTRLTLQQTAAVLSTCCMARARSDS
jgi:hypothetical protein